MNINRSTNLNLSREHLLYEYLSIVRGESQQTSRIIEEYLRSISSLNNNIYHLLTALNENSETTPLISRNRSQSPISTWRNNRISHRNRNNTFYTPFTSSNNNSFNTTFPTTLSNNSFSNSTSSTFDLPSSSNFSLPRSRRTRISRRYRNVASNTTASDALRDLLQTTLYTPTRPIPASQTDISNNTSVHTWRDISNTTDQTICPITQEDILSIDTVRRIDGCGHVFHDGPLERYLRNFDHRCPICRYDIRTRERDLESGENRDVSGSILNNRNTTTPRFPPGMGFDVSGNNSYNSAIGNNMSGNDISGNDISGNDISGNDVSGNTRTISTPFDFSFDNTFVSNLTSSLANNLTTNLNNSFRDLSNVEFTSNLDISSNDFNNAVNFMSSALLTGLSEAINNPDLSGNTITAEYSVFLPRPTREHED